MNILLVVKELPLRCWAKTTLVQESHKIDVTGTMGEGIFRTLNADVDMVVLDECLFDFQSLQMYVKLCRCRRVKILVLHDDLDQRMASLELEPENFLSKPYSRQEFHARVQAMSWMGPCASDERLSADASQPIW